MPLRTNVREESVLAAPAAPPVILPKVKWVGKGGKYYWCWAACAVMIMRSLKKPWEDEKNDRRLLCAVAQESSLRGNAQSCCQPDQCDKKLSPTDISQLWKALLISSPLPPPITNLNPSASINDWVNEIQVNGRAVEVDVGRDKYIGHVVVIYGFQRDGSEINFYVHDPDLKPDELSPVAYKVSASSLAARCENYWLGIK